MPATKFVGEIVHADVDRALKKDEKPSNIPLLPKKSDAEKITNADESETCTIRRVKIIKHGDLIGGLDHRNVWIAYCTF